AETRGGAERIGVIDVAAPNDGDRFETAVRVLRKARHDLTVVHTPAVGAGEVLPEIATGEGGCGAHALVARGVSVVVMDAEEEGVGGLPLEAEGAGIEHDSLH